MAHTQTRRTDGVLSFADVAFSAERGRSMWDDCPQLAILQDPSIAHIYRNHFQDYAPADWTITTTEDGAGDATEAIADELGGVLLITNDAGANDSDELQRVGETFQLVANKPAWVEAGFKINDATQSIFLFGLCITDTTLIDGMTDGVYLRSDDGDAILDWHVMKDSSETTGSTGVTLSDGGWFRPGLKLLADGSIEIWVNGRIVAASTTNVPDDELLRLSMALQNGEAVAKTLSADYIEAVQMLKRY